MVREQLGSLQALTCDKQAERGALRAALQESRDQIVDLEEALRDASTARPAPLPVVGTKPCSECSCGGSADGQLSAASTTKKRNKTTAAASHQHERCSSKQLKEALQRERRGLAALVVEILAAHQRGSAGASMSIAELSTRIKLRTGKAWGGHWAKRHGPLLRFLQTSCAGGGVEASCRSGVRLAGRQGKKP